MQLSTKDIHVWSATLTMTADKENDYLAMLSDDERERAHRFHFPIHRQRFIASHGILRRILSKYIGIGPKKITFEVDDYGKPHLTSPYNAPLQFNLAHSENMAAYAFTLETPIGIDLEFMQDDFNPDIIKRFCSAAEYQALLKLSGYEQKNGFFTLWSRKEAIIKAIGHGLSLPLRDFTVSLEPVSECIALVNQYWALEPLSLHPNYQASLAYLKQSTPKKIIQQTASI